MDILNRMMRAAGPSNQTAGVYEVKLSDGSRVEIGEVRLDPGPFTVTPLESLAEVTEDIITAHGDLWRRLASE